MASLRRPHLALLLLFSLLVTLISASCYEPDHDVIESDQYQPCGNGVSSDDASMCCAVRRDGGSADACVKNGLCSNPLIDANDYWRESCTDRSWQSESCLKLCIDGKDSEGNPMGSGDRLVTKCPNGSFCCKDMNTTCCDDGLGLWIDNSTFQLRNYDPAETTIISTTSTSSTSSSSSTSTSSSSSITTPSTSIPVGAITDASSKPSATAKPSSSNTGAIAGGAVGGVAGLAIICGLLFFLFRRRRSKKTGRLDGHNGGGHVYHEASADAVQSSARAEKDGAELVEMQGSELRSRNVELEGTPFIGEHREHYKSRDEDSNRQEEYKDKKPGEYKTHIAENLALANDDRFR